MKIKSELRKAILTSLMGKYSLYVLQLISIATLARIFAPEVFGIVATAQVFVLFFQMLATSGLAPAIVFQEKISVQMRNGVFSFSLIAGLLLAIIFLFLAAPLHSWFGFGEGLVVFYVLAPCVLFSSLSMMPMASLQKDAKFLVIARAEIAAETLSLAACIIASHYWSEISALALKFLLVPILRFVFYYQSSNKTSIGLATFGKEVKQVTKLYSYAKYQISFNVLNFFASNLDNILIAKYFGAASLGIYEKTYQVMRYPLQLFTFAITPALQPILTKYKRNPGVVFTAYFDVAHKLAFVGVLSASILYWNAKDVVFILFGAQWSGTVPYLQIMAISIPVQMVLSSTGGVYQAFGQTRAMFWCGVFSSIVTLTAITIGIYHHSILALCKALVVAYSINFMQCFFMLFFTVFRGKSLKQFMYLCTILSLSGFNLLLEPPLETSSNSYFTSVVDIAYTAVTVGLPLVAIFILGQKCKAALKEHL